MFGYRSRRYWLLLVRKISAEMRRLGLFVVLFIFFSVLYISLQSQSIYGGDGGDFASAVVSRGIPHPPGYPLFTALGITLETLIPGGSVAWKMTFLSSIFGVLSLCVIYLLLLRLNVNRWASFITVATLGFSYPFWLYSEVLEVFSLNTFFLT